MAVSCIAQQQQFPAVSEPDDILTEDLMKYSHGMTEIIGHMGRAFSFTKDDMLSNIKKVGNKYETDKEKLRCFKAVLQDEIDKKENKNDKSATVGGLWLKRGLEYVSEFFWHLVAEHDNSKLPGQKTDSNSPSHASSKAYDLTLTKYHNFASRLLVKAGSKLTPYKETMMANLAQGVKDMDDKVIEEMRVYEAAMREFVHVLGKLFQEFGHKDECLRSAKDGAQK